MGFKYKMVGSIFLGSIVRFNNMITMIWQWLLNYGQLFYEFMSNKNYVIHPKHDEHKRLELSGWSS